METRTYNVYKYDELTDEQKQKALDNWRNTDEMGLYDSINNDEYMKEKLKEAGLEFDTMYWNTYPFQAGFSKLSIADWSKLAKRLKIDRRTRLYRLLSNGDVQVEFSQDNRGYAEINYVSWDDYRAIDDINNSDDEQIDKFCEDLCELVKEFEREAIEWIRAEEEWVNSDEYIADTIRANDYDFTTDGRIA